MGYTALEAMHQKNKRDYGIDAPYPPPDLRENKTMRQWERQCITFVRDTCEDLRITEEAGEFHGTSLAFGQISHAMQMDVDRLCLENAIHRFMNAGTAEDAFDVYFCYLEMFVRPYGKTKNMVEAAFEANAGSPLMQHGEHDVHSVNVFLLGMALYQSNPVFRNIYLNFYKLENDTSAAHHFIRAWGWTALFHDTGSPAARPVEPTKRHFGNAAPDAPARPVPLAPNLHPLAYLLMLCDALQCSASCGQTSTRELYPMGCDFEFTETGIVANYQYDVCFAPKKDVLHGAYEAMEGAHSAFLRNIEGIVQLNGAGELGLQVNRTFTRNSRRTNTTQSQSNFRQLYPFAVALNDRYLGAEGLEGLGENGRAVMEQHFESLSLEYKLSNILQAKAFANYLDDIGCFYTDRPVNHEPLTAFSEQHMAIIGPQEHTRWVNEKRSMGWRYDTAYLDPKKVAPGVTDPGRIQTQIKIARERTRTHAMLIPNFAELSASERDKDTAPMNLMLRLMEEFGGLRIYRA